MKVCPYCGRYCDDRSMTCAHCGGDLPAADHVPAQSAGGFAAASGFGETSYPQTQQTAAPAQNDQTQYPPQYNQTQYPVQQGEVQKMPSKGLHLTLMILGFFLGVVWGFLCIGPYKAMNIAIQNGDAVTAANNAKKIRLFFFIGLAVNVVVLYIRARTGI